MNGLLNKLFDVLRDNAVVLFIGLGMGVYRCAHEWPVWFNGVFGVAAIPALGDSSFFLAIDAGKIVGAVLYLSLCYLFDKTRGNGVLLVLPSAVLVASYAGPLAMGLGIAVPPGIVVGSLVLCGMGAGMLFAQWIEVCGQLAPVKVIEALAVSYLARILLLPVIVGCEPWLSAVVIICLAGTSFVQIAYCYRLIGPLALERSARELPRRGTGTGYGILFVWACVYTFTYGLGEGITHLSHSVAVSGIGYALPSLLVLVLGLKLADRFDRNLLIIASVPLMAAGLVSLEFFGASAAFAQVLVSAGMCAFELLTYTTACIYAFRSRTSSMFAGGCVRVVGLLSADVAVLLVRFVPASNASLLIVFATLVTVVMAFVMFLPQVNERLEQRSLRRADMTSGFEEGADERGGDGLTALIATAGFSPREETVFLLLADGKSASQIAEELFISNGAVRAHCSRIYSKCDVHSRKDFDELLARTRR